LSALLKKSLQQENRVNSRKSIVLYARALSMFDGAQADDALAAARAIAAGVDRVEALVHFLNHPGIELSEKLAVLQEFCGTPFSPPLREILQLMVKSRSAGLMPEVLKEMDRIRLATQGTSEVLVTTAFPLDDKQREMIEIRLKASLNGRMQVGYQVRSDLIAGAQIKIGNVVFDNSTRRALDGVHTWLDTVYGR
jgi:F-type H+-transporting ATPase subunit delta